MKIVLTINSKRCKVVTLITEEEEIFGEIAGIGILLEAKEAGAVEGDRHLVG